jgi:geranylgeranyl reductase family protein
LDDAIVVGAGPAGNAAALGLASRGFSVTVLDGRRNIGDKLCTGIVGRECTQRFPIDPALVYRHSRSAQVISPQGETVSFESPQHQASVVDRVQYVASFARRAQAAGARYVLGCRVAQVQTSGQGVTAATDAGVFSARCLVVAAGYGSPLTKQLGMGSVADHVTGAQTVVYTTGVEGVEVHLGQEVAPGFFSWLVPTLPGQALAGLLARRHAAERLHAFVQTLQRHGKVAGVARATACWGIPLRPLRRTYGDRVVVVGDAAGQVKPLTGGGIYYSLLAGELAALTLSEALSQDDLSCRRLSQYQQRWHALLSAELESTYFARKLYELLSDQQIGFLLRASAGSGPNGLRAQLADGSVSFDWHSRILSRMAGNPAISGVLQLLTPLLCRLAPQPGRADEEEAAAENPGLGLAHRAAHWAD